MARTPNSAFGLVVAAIVFSGSSAHAQVSGRVRYEGPRPKPQAIDLRTDPVCSAIAHGATTNHTVVGPDGGLANVFVYVDAVPAAARAVATSTVVLQQQRCRYAPKVFGIVVGQPLEIRNGDPTLHTTHADKADGFNVVTPRRGQRVRKTFDRPQVMVPLKCDVHPWMKAYAGVLSHPYFAVTDGTGRFTLPEGLPDGDYQVRLWHETLGRRSTTARVRAGRGTIAVVFRGVDQGLGQPTAR